MEIKWMHALIDLPAEVYEGAQRFWSAVSDTTLGPINPEHPEYRHLNPSTGDMVLEMQRINDGPPTAHLDLAVNDVPAGAQHAIESGASLVAEHPGGHVVLKTPGGVQFCVIPWNGQHQKAPAIDPTRPHAIDQICLDVPHHRFDDDLTFWTTLTGWNINPPKHPEFRSLDQPSHLPLRILIQQLGADDTGGPRAHLDISSGAFVEALAPDHQRAGANVVDRFHDWILLEAPGGLPYCLTSRQPDVG